MALHGQQSQRGRIGHRGQEAAHRKLGNLSCDQPFPAQPLQLRCYAVIQSAILLQFAMLAVQRAVHNTAHHTRCHERLQAADHQMDCFICTDAVNPAKCPRWSIPVSPRSESVGLVGSFAYR
jgi:hypothetical protein